MNKAAFSFAALFIRIFSGAFEKMFDGKNNEALYRPSNMSFILMASSIFFFYDLRLSHAIFD
jgi:hypothetical protein